MTYQVMCRTLPDGLMVLPSQLPLACGGTGLDTSGVVDGQILIGNSTGNVWALGSITGTAKRVTVSLGAGTISLSGPQDLSSADSPTFAGATLTSGLTLTGATVTGAPTWSSNQTITLATAAQPNVISVGTLTGLTMGGTLTVGANTLALASSTVSGAPTWSSNQTITLATAAQPNITSLGTLTGLTMGGTLTLGANTLALASGTVSGSPTWSSNQAITLSTAAQGNITSLGTLTGLALSGKITSYNNVATAGEGVPDIRAQGSIRAQSAAATITSYANPAADGDFEVSGQMSVTASTTLAANITCTYTDVANVARSLILPIMAVAGTLIAAGAISGAGATIWHTPVVHIRVKASTTITLKTAGATYTGVTYSASGVIKKTS